MHRGYADKNRFLGNGELRGGARLSPLSQNGIGAENGETGLAGPAVEMGDVWGTRRLHKVSSRQPQEKFRVSRDSHPGHTT